MRQPLAIAATAATGVLLISMAISDPVSAASPNAKRVCPRSTVGYASCNSWIRTDVGGQPAAVGTPAGYGPSDLQSAYNLAAASANNGTGVTVAIVDAYDDPSAFNDVNVYRAQYGEPALASCSPSTIKSSTTPCFAKSDQNGGTAYPAKNASWAQEISLDLDMVSATCPHCNILLVEANTASFADLGTSVNTAANLGAAVVSNSYGGSESSSEASWESAYYNHPGVAITASSGDSGYGVQFPAASRDVTAVGGTSLTKASNARGWSETAWSGAGSGCSAYITKPPWQTDAGCANRTVADVSAVADPNTGVAVYDSTAYQGQSGWLVFGGTSVASPVIASVYALAGNASTVNYGSYPYSHTSSLYDVTSGSNGTCGGSYLCTAGPGYDGPTGLGTPSGTGGF